MTNLIKYPRTFHLPWSAGATSDDKTLDDVDHFFGRPVIVSLKMDGENTTMYSEAIHARSIDSKDHESRHYVKATHARIKHDLPKGERICGENLFARHSIPYQNLPDYFLAFSVWIEHTCLSWPDTLAYLEMLDLKPVPVIFQGILQDELTLKIIQNRFEQEFAGHEGYVIRTQNHFSYDNFHLNVAKYVRNNHVQTDKHWMHQQIMPNGMDPNFGPDWFYPKNCIARQ